MLLRLSASCPSRMSPVAASFHRERILAIVAAAASRSFCSMSICASWTRGVELSDRSASAWQELASLLGTLQRVGQDLGPHHGQADVVGVVGEERLEDPVGLLGLAVLGGEGGLEAGELGGLGIPAAGRREAACEPRPSCPAPRRSARPGSRRRGSPARRPAAGRAAPAPRRAARAGRRSEPGGARSRSRRPARAPRPWRIPASARSRSPGPRRAW